MLALKFGTASSVNLEPDSNAVWTVCEAPRGQPLARLREAVDEALTSPLGFPSLAQAVVPGDKVVLALDHDVPGVATIVAAAVELLVAAGVSPADITVLCPADDRDNQRPDPRGELAAATRDAVALKVHDPLDRPSLCYLAAAADSSPIYIDRAIHEADLVIPIGVLRAADSPGYHGIHTAVFPSYSDAESLARFRSSKASESEHRRLRKQVDEVAWLVGVPFTIQVVPGAGADVLHVLAGDPQAVIQEGARRYDAAWAFSLPMRAELVVATIEGDASQQTWANLGRALASAAAALDDDGALVVCSSLDAPLGPALRRLVGADNLETALASIARGRDVDALWAAQLARLLARGKVYLVSLLDEEIVEDLGMLPLDERGVARVVARATSGVVLPNAHYTCVSAGGELAGQQPSAARGSRR